MRKAKPGRSTWIPAIFVALLCCIAGYLYCSYASGSAPIPGGGAPAPLPSAEPDPLGLLLIDVATPEQAEAYDVTECGVYVLAVSESSPAQRAGMRSGDRVTALNGVEVLTVADLYDLLSRVEEGEPTRLTVLRAGEERVWTLDAGDAAPRNAD